VPSALCGFPPQLSKLTILNFWHYIEKHSKFFFSHYFSHGNLGRSKSKLWLKMTIAKSGNIGGVLMWFDWCFRLPTRRAPIPTTAIKKKHTTLSSLVMHLGSITTQYIPLKSGLCPSFSTEKMIVKRRRFTLPTGISWSTLTVWTLRSTWRAQPSEGAWQETSAQ